MRGFVLQDWLTIKGTSTTTSVVQNESDYLALDNFQDVVFWVQCSETSGGTVTINFETAPIKDESLFSPITVTSGPVLPAALVQQAAPKIYPVYAWNANTTIPLSRWLRWHLIGPAAAWDATFRVLVSGNQLFAWPQPGFGGMAGFGGPGWAQGR